MFRRKRFFDGRPVRRRDTEHIPDISWFRPDGTEMSDAGLGLRLRQVRRGLSQRPGHFDLDPRGRRVIDDSFVLCFNAHHEPIHFTLPPAEFGPAWRPVVDTAAESGLATGFGVSTESAAVNVGEAVRVAARRWSCCRA